MTEIRNVPIERLEPDSANVRPEPDLTQEFVESVRSRGILQPLIVRPRGDRYGVVVGKRRYYAARKVGLETLPCEVREDLEDDMDARAVSMSENWQRLDIPEWRRREVIQEFYDDTDERRGKEKRVGEVSDRLNVSRRTVQRYLVLGRLSRTILDRLKEPKERSDSENKRLEKMPLGASEEKPLFDDRGVERTPSDLDVTKRIPVKVAEKLARSDHFLELAEREPARAHLVATLAAEAGQKGAEKVIEMDEEGPKERRKSFREIYGGPARLGVELSPTAMKALAEWADDHDKRNRKKAAQDMIMERLEQDGYYELIGGGRA